MEAERRQLFSKVWLPSLEKTVGEDLVHDRALGIGRDRVAVRHAAELPFAACFHIGVLPLLEEAEGLIGGFDAEIVEI